MLSSLLLAAAAVATSQEEYDRKFIGFDDFVMVAVSRYGSSATPDAEPYQGKFKKPLPGAALADEYNRALRAGFASPQLTPVAMR